MILGVALMGVVAFSRRLRDLVRLTWLLNRLPQKLRGMLQMVDRAIFFYRDQRLVIVASLIAGMANHVLSVLCVVMLGKAIGVGMPTFEYFVFVPVINILSAVPIAPNGWGVGEVMYGYLFAEHGASLPAAGRPMPRPRCARAASRCRSSTDWCLTSFSFLAGLLLLFEKDRVTKEDIDREVALEEEESGQAIDAHQSAAEVEPSRGWGD